MKKIIILVAALLILAAALLICLLPRATTLEYTLDTVCFNADGEQMGMFQIVVQGQQTDALFRDPQLELSIMPFDRLSWLKVVAAEGENPVYHDGDIRFSYYVAADKVTGEVGQCTLGFDSKMERWIIVDHSRQLYYVASTNSDYSADELTAFFVSLIPANW